jgi:hypothetical protein
MTEKTFNLSLTKDEMLMIVTALGTLKDRIGQKAGWLQRKRMPTLRGRLADCVTIGDETEADGVRKAMRRATNEIEKRINAGEEIAGMMNSLKTKAEITDERWKCYHEPEE